MALNHRGTFIGPEQAGHRGHAACPASKTAVCEKLVHSKDRKGDVCLSEVQFPDLDVGSILLLTWQNDHLRMPWTERKLYPHCISGVDRIRQRLSADSRIDFFHSSVCLGHSRWAASPPILYFEKGIWNVRRTLWQYSENKNTHWICQSLYLVLVV